MAATERPKRVIDRERQWRKLDAGRYASPKGRFIAARDDDGWLLADITGEVEPAWYARWRDARRAVEVIEFADPATAPIEFVEDEIVDEFRDVYRIKAVRGSDELFEVVVRRGWVMLPETAAMSIEEAEAFATALRLATHRAAVMTRKEA